MSVDSIGANIAEGVGRWSYRENKRFVLIARGSLYEVKHWWRRAYRRGLLTENQSAELRAMIDALPPA